MQLYTQFIRYRSDSVTLCSPLKSMRLGSVLRVGACWCGNKDMDADGGVTVFPSCVQPAASLTFISSSERDFTVASSFLLWSSLLSAFSSIDSWKTTKKIHYMSKKSIVLFYTPLTVSKSFSSNYAFSIRCYSIKDRHMGISVIFSANIAFWD